MKKLSNILSNSFITNIEQLREEYNRQMDEEMLNEAKSNKPKYFFSNIIFFTNERDSRKNKTLKNLEDAISGTDINLVVLVADEVSYTADDAKIEIEDKKTKYTIDKQSNVDTICIVQLGAKDSEQCVECIKEIQNWGIYTLNPIQAALTASNKYASSVLMRRYDIPQPRFALRLC